jgi:hypothetical protein
MIGHNGSMQLRADRVELALLNLIVAWRGGSPGPAYRLHRYREAVLPTVDDVTGAEIVESLRVLHENGLIEIDRYVGFTPVPYDDRQGDSFFRYRGGLSL